MSTPTPQGAPTPTPAAPPAPEGGQPPVATPPVPTPPPSAPAQPAAPAAPTGDDEPLNLTKGRFNEIITTRINEVKQSLAAEQAAAQAERDKQLAAIFGVAPSDTPPDPAELLKQSQAEVAAAHQRADLADTRALAIAAGVKPDRVDLFMRLVDVGDVLKDVNRGDGAAISTALKSAVDTALTAAPEFKGVALPGSSGGDLKGGAAPSLDEQIATAEKNRDFRTAIALKRQRAAQQGR